MDFWGFIGEFFLKPIYEHSGYNAYNTLAYAALAIAAAYLIFRLLKKLGIKIDARFAYSIIPFILLGSALRVAADAIDPAFPATAAWSAARSPVLAAISAAGINLYALFASPGVYLIVGPLTVACVLLANRLGRMGLLPWAGALMLAFPLLAILPLFTNFVPLAAVLALALAGLAAGVAAISALRKAALFGGGWSMEPGARGLGWVAVFSHAMDGAATFVSIDLFGALGGV
ncbi:MAG: DUF63 family protein, partial [Candidatus ainarchaeum sp.]|nr:DUF63 family protein [Candidatus ainarchaeum sp.]